MRPALVLAAGLGTRLDPLTRLVAKPAVPLGGRTLIERVLDWLARGGVQDVVVNLHHRPETIAAVVGDGAHLGLRVRYSWERVVLGSAGGPRHALPLFDGPSLVIVNGDTLCDLDLPALVDAHTRSGADVTMAVIPNPAPDRYNGIEADAHHRVRGFVPKGHAGRTWHFVGVQVVQASVFAALPDDRAAETVAGLYRDRVNAGDDRIHVWPAQTAFVDVGTPRDYLDAALHVADGPGEAGLVARGAMIDPSARITRSVIWPGVRIARDVALDRCIVADGADVPPGVHARESVLVPASLIRAGDSARVVGDVAVFPL